MPGGWEIVIILGVLVLLFGAKRLPDMARSIGQSARVFKGEMKGLQGDDAAPSAPAPATPPAAPGALPGANGQQPTQQNTSGQPGTTAQ